MKKFNVGLYLRLSKDDGEEGRAESNSIVNQRNMLRTFVKSQNNMLIYEEYIDDGFSGANFQRPSFIKMIKDMDLGLIDCIVVKDLSRFGRDYIEAGRYIQKIFPSNDIRFISINDNYDSDTADQAEANLVLAVKNFVNDSYCRDISTKVRSSQHTKRLRGEFIGSFPVFGYQKDPADKNKLIIDEEAAKTVSLIFKWKLKGFSTQAIGNKLNDLEIDSPLAYKMRKGSRFNTSFNSSPKSQWSAVSVGRVLSNAIYIGRLEQGKSEKINYKLKKEIEKPKGEWIIVEDAHEKIISKEIYDKVQRLLKRDLRLSENKKEPHKYSGMLFCADCGRALIRRVNRYKGKERVFFICSTYNRGKGCSRHSIKEKDLDEVLFSSLNKHIVTSHYYWDRLGEVASKGITESKALDLDARLNTLEKDRQKYEILKSSLYEDMRDGLIDEKEFASFRKNYQGRIDEISLAIKSHKDLVSKVFKEGVHSKDKIKSIANLKKLTELDRMSIVLLVDQIIIYEDKKIEIVFNYKDEIDIISSIINNSDNSILEENKEVV